MDTASTIMQEYVWYLFVSLVAIAGCDGFFWLMHYMSGGRWLVSQPPPCRMAMLPGCGLLLLVLIPWMIWRLHLPYVVAILTALGAVTYSWVTAEFSTLLLHKTRIAGLGYWFGFAFGLLGAARWFSVVASCVHGRPCS